MDSLHTNQELVLTKSLVTRLLKADLIEQEYTDSALKVLTQHGYRKMKQANVNPAINPPAIDISHGRITRSDVTDLYNAGVINFYDRSATFYVFTALIVNNMHQTNQQNRILQHKILPSRKEA